MERIRLSKERTQIFRVDFKKGDPMICGLQGMHFKREYTDKPKAKGWEKAHAISCCINIRSKTPADRVSPEIEGHFIITKGSIYHEVLTVTNVYELNNRASTYARQDSTDPVCTRAGPHRETGLPVGSPWVVLHEPPTDQEKNSSPSCD